MSDVGPGSYKVASEIGKLPSYMKIRLENEKKR